MRRARVLWVHDTTVRGGGTVITKRGRVTFTRMIRLEGIEGLGCVLVRRQCKDEESMLLA